LSKNFAHYFFPVASWRSSIIIPF